MSRQRVEYPTVDVGGRELVLVQYLVDGLITFRSKREARRLYRAGSAGIMGPEDWARIKSEGGAGLSVDPAYV